MFTTIEEELYTQPQWRWCGLPATGSPCELYDCSTCLASNNVCMPTLTEDLCALFADYRWCGATSLAQAGPRKEARGRRSAGFLGPDHRATVGGAFIQVTDDLGRRESVPAEDDDEPLGERQTEVALDGASQEL